MHARAWLLGAAAIAGFAVLTVAGLYVAAALYFLHLKIIPTALDAGTFLSLWDQFGYAEPLRHQLQTCAVMAAAIVYGGPIALAIAATRTSRSLHGDARFARAGEIAKAGLNARHGILIGKYRGRFLCFGGEQFVLLAARTRSGKGVGVVIPNLLSWGDSAVVTDIKLENFQITSGFRAKHGHAVYLFNPFAEDFRTHRWNPLSGINRNEHFRIGDILAIAGTFYPSGTSASSNNEAFFNDQAQNLFLGLVLYLLETPGLPCTLGEVLRQGSGCGQPVEKHLRQILTARAGGERPLSPACIDALTRFISNSENTLASIKASFEAPLLIFANPIVDAATSGDDFDLRDLRRLRMTVYVGIQPNRLESASRLLNVFFSQLINLNTDKLRSQDPSLICQCLLVMDEFTAMGKVPMLAKSIAFIAGYGLRMLPIVQSLDQIIDVYGREAAANFIKNHEVKVIFPPDDIDEAERVSRSLGYLTERARSTGSSRSSGFERSSNVSRNENVSEQRRALLLPQEIRELPPHQEIIFKPNCKPILAEKIRYYDDPAFAPRLLPPVDVPQMDMALHKAIVEQRVRPLAPGEVKNIDLSRLAIDTSAIAAFTGDPHHPTKEEAEAVVDSFFAQLEWEAEPDAPPSPRVATAPGRAPHFAGRIDLSLLDS